MSHAVRRRLSRVELLIIIICIGLFLGFCLASITRSSTWHDESYTATLIESGAQGIVKRTALDVHPPLYYLALRGWSNLFGDSLFTLRLFSVVCMQGAILVAWAIIRRITHSRRAAAWALLAMSCGPFLVRYGQEMRMYGFAALLAMLATWVWLSLQPRRRGHLLPSGLTGYAPWVNACLYGLLVAAGMYTQYFFVLVPLVHILYSLVTTEGTPLIRLMSLRRYLLAMLLAVGLFAPWVPTVLGQFGEVQGAFWIGPVSLETLTATPIAMLLLMKQHEMTGWYGLLAFVTLVFAICSIRRYYVIFREPQQKLALLSVLVPPLALFALSLPPLQPSYQDRYMSFFGPLFYSAMVLGALHLARKSMLRPLAIGGLFGMLLLGQINNYHMGTSYGWSPQPYFTIDLLHSHIKAGDSASKVGATASSSDSLEPVYSTSLWTFLDAHTAIKDRSVQLLLAENPTSWKGNWSAIYERPELITLSIPSSVRSFWLLDESGKAAYSGSALENYTAGEMFTAGYAKLVHYSR